MTQHVPEQPTPPEQPDPARQSAPLDARSNLERATDETIAALFRESGLALSNGHAPAIQGADARARAAEEEAIAAVFQAADRLQPVPGPDFRQMAKKARQIAQERGPVTAAEDELLGERVRSDLQQLPDLEVRCWNVSHTASLPVETAVPAAAVPAEAVAPVDAAAETVLPVAETPAELPATVKARLSSRKMPVLTAHDAANIRENNWTEFKQRYHREYRARVLELSAAGVFGAAACFLLVWFTGSLTQSSSNGSATPSGAVKMAARSEAPANLLTSGEPLGGRRPVSSPLVQDTVDRAPAQENDDTQYIPVDADSPFGPEQTGWIKRNAEFVGTDLPRNIEAVGSPQIWIPKHEFDPNPSRMLGSPVRAARPGDNAAPELFPERGQGLRIISLNPRSDCAQAGLVVNDWVTRVLKLDGSSIDLSAGSAENLAAWNGFLAGAHPGDSFDVEFQRGPLIRRTTVSLSQGR